jgi:hypothetical protein
VKNTRLREILNRKAPATAEESLARIREAVEGGIHVCPRCGFPHFSGGIHPYAGISAETKNQTRWCTGRATIEPKDRVQDWKWRCSVCKRDWFYSQAEIELADSDGRCHECVGKN